jgi:hypothetical protein
MSRERSVAHQAIFNSFQQKDERSLGVMGMVANVYPAFAKKIFEGNRLMQAIVTSGYNMMDILDYPICGSCESIALFNEEGIKDGVKVDRCTCVKCGQHTLDPITFRQFILMEMKSKVKPEYFNELELIVDKLAEDMMRAVMSKLRTEFLRHNAQGNRKMGIVMPDGYTRAEVQKPVVQHLMAEPKEAKGIEFTKGVGSNGD